MYRYVILMIVFLYSLDVVRSEDVSYWDPGTFNEFGIQLNTGYTNFNSIGFSGNSIRTMELEQNNSCINTVSFGINYFYLGYLITFELNYLSNNIDMESGHFNLLMLDNNNTINDRVNIKSTLKSNFLNFNALYRIKLCRIAYKTDWIYISVLNIKTGPGFNYLLNSEINYLLETTQQGLELTDMKDVKRINSGQLEIRNNETTDLNKFLFGWLLGLDLYTFLDNPFCKDVPTNSNQNTLIFCASINYSYGLTNFVKDNNNHLSRLDFQLQVHIPFPPYITDREEEY